MGQVPAGQHSLTSLPMELQQCIVHAYSDVTNYQKAVDQTPPIVFQSSLSLLCISLLRPLCCSSPLVWPLLHAIDHLACWWSMPTTLIPELIFHFVSRNCQADRNILGIWNFIFKLVKFVLSCFYYQLQSKYLPLHS